jgi:hypothetical protein
MDLIEIDYVSFDDYTTVYVDGNLVAEGSSVPFWELAEIIREKSVKRVDVWLIEEADVDVEKVFATYNPSILILNN